MTSTSAVSSSAEQIYSSLNSTKGKSASTVDEQQSRFLKLLTTQLKNQDPLNPMDNAQTTSQLAQISTVDGIERLNATLSSLVGSMGAGDALQAASMVGRSVLVPGSSMLVASGMGVGGIQLEGSADKVSVTISDKNGLELKRLDMGALEAGTHELIWDGKNESGTVVADGSYTVKVTAFMGEGKVLASPLELARVNSVVTGGKELELDLGKLGRVSMGDIKLIL